MSLALDEMLNATIVAPADRAEPLLRYRNQKLAKVDWGSLTALVAGDEEMPLSMASDRASLMAPHAIVRK